MSLISAGPAPDELNRVADRLNGALSTHAVASTIHLSIHSAYVTVLQSVMSATAQQSVSDTGNSMYVCNISD